MLIKHKGIIVVLLIGLLIGGKITMDKWRDKELLLVEKRLVRALKNTFADIQTIKIDKCDQNDVTGSYGMNITMTNIEGQTVSFFLTFWKNNNEIGTYTITNEQLQKEGKTKTSVKVIYSNGLEDEQ
ncbi:TPA: hypothetical protein TUM56_001955 [Streptococcus equi subsp. zooepidemicus]|uniref:DUF1310 family protein n=2 Tax=Streptococcus equi TaxID=1336 RepID=A0A6M1KNV6_9STRE|nr:hypothetical protein [Streptococcus equi]KIS04831.1 hypothetical protein N594_01863 [Streptococcus equi subsp. zooepidemicus Sz16]KIS11197.1 hypothetical protein AT51_01687 [Streptococcus equi subsp. zooepidemicus Sz57]MCD3376082.1 hypothetical protein [Streptococcus equi subsp. zooepidemicus]MCD3383917.1 hypothetical protein [Streptococcus equi subsp. zooepidemicus]MCD3392579.1 hypothetical protein [Streptococcus equi subsp. zooepidemicus]